MLIAVVVVVTNFAVDMLYAAIDPRIRYTDDFQEDLETPLDRTQLRQRTETRRRPSDACWRRLAFLAQRYMLGTIGLFIMLTFVWVAAFADLICRFDPLSVDSAHRLAAPSMLHWLGTDSFGRDVWSRIVHGARISLAVASVRPRWGRRSA